MTRRAFAAVCLGLVLLVASVHTEGTLYLEDVSSDGAVLVLSDDSVWHVEFADQTKASLWLPLQRVAVARTSSPGLYRIVRESQGDSVRAKFVK